MDPLENANPAGAALVGPDVLAAAAADLAAADAPTPGAADTPAAAPVAADPNAEAKELIEFAYSLFAPVYPSLANVYKPEIRARLAATAAPLLTKYGINLGKLGPEVMFALNVVPLIAPTIQAIRADRAAAAGEKPAAATVPAAPVAPQPADVSPLAAFPGVSLES